jgi:Fe-S cluster assembly iron-binding protein IscA
MILRLSRAAVTALREELTAHPGESVVRLAVRDVDEARVSLDITLDAGPHAGDQLQISDGVTIAVAAQSVDRLRGAVLEYDPARGFSLRHPEHEGTGNGDPLPFEP